MSRFLLDANLSPKTRVFEAVNVLLGHFFTSEAQSIDLDSSLVVLREDHVRIVRSH